MQLPSKSFRYIQFAPDNLNVLGRYLNRCQQLEIESADLWINPLGHLFLHLRKVDHTVCIGRPFPAFEAMEDSGTVGKDVYVRERNPDRTDGIFRKITFPSVGFHCMFLRVFHPAKLGITNIATYGTSLCFGRFLAQLGIRRYVVVVHVTQPKSRVCLRNRQLQPWRRYCRIYADICGSNRLHFGTRLESA